MRKNLLFTAEELLLDERFLSWVEGASNEYDNQWINSLVSFSVDQEIEVADAVSMHQAICLPARPTEGMYQQKDRLLEQLDRFVLHTRQKRASKNILVTTAVLALLFMLLGGYWFYSSEKSSLQQLGGVIDNSRRLSDGTLIKLTANSTITLNPDFEKAQQREVWVKGEIEFAVQKKKDNKPFIVHMDPFDVLVTGTVFQTTNLPERSSVLLREGSVELIFKDGHRLKMSPGDFYAYHRPTLAPRENPGLLQEGPVVEKKIVFEDLSIAEVAAQIESRYPVQIIIPSAELASRRITGILPNDNLEVLINALQIATESVSQQKGSTFVFTPQ
ncbi:MAG: FecR family protein [Sphingomonadales bacterium]